MATATEKLNGKGATANTADLANQIEVLRKDLGALTQTITDLGKAKGDDAVALAQSKAADIRERATDAGETARLQALELQDQANDFVKNQPATALGIAAGIGFLVGFMGTRK